MPDEYSSAEYKIIECQQMNQVHAVLARRSQIVDHADDCRIVTENDNSGVFNAVTPSQNSCNKTKQFQILDTWLVPLNVVWLPFSVQPFVAEYSPKTQIFTGTGI